MPKVEPCKVVSGENMERWVLISDESGHSYACPEEKAEEALESFQSIAKYWGTNGGHQAYLPEPPSYVIRIDGTFTFTDPKVL